MTWEYDIENKKYNTDLFVIEEYSTGFILFKKSIFKNKPLKFIGMFLKISSAKQVADLLING